LSPKAASFEVYVGAKTHAERELWTFGDAHPHLDITTSEFYPRFQSSNDNNLTCPLVNPPFLYGPFAPSFNNRKLAEGKPNYYALSTNLYIYRVLRPDGPYPASPLYVDLRDAALAHVLALDSPLSSENKDIGRKRLIISSPQPFDFARIKPLLLEKRPELNLGDRFTKVAPPPLVGSPGPTGQKPVPNPMPYDVDRLEKVLGMKRTDFKSFEETILAAFDSLVELEKEWVEAGASIDIPSE
jgi:nucleoside-diphosphate-sugar epimerase